jgi:hypothetical protein
MSYFAILSGGSVLAALATVGLVRRRARRRWRAAVDAYAEREIIRDRRRPPPRRVRTGSARSAARQEIA